MGTKWFAVILMVICTLFTSTAQIFYKFGAVNLPVIFTNIPLITGLVLYGFGAIIFVTALKFGEVTVVYPIIATSYIWVALFSWIIFNDNMNFHKIFGISAIVAGITIISLGSRMK